jgi:hypothetical protein
MFAYEFDPSIWKEANVWLEPLVTNLDYLVFALLFAFLLGFLSGCCRKEK